MNRHISYLAVLIPDATSEGNLAAPGSIPISTTILRRRKPMSPILSHRRSVLVAFFGCLTAMLQFVTPLLASVTLPNLVPGSQYQLLFVTADTIQATSSNIDDYNSFVTQEAGLNHSLPSDVTWHAVCSTSSTPAISNAPTWNDIPIYGTNGQLIAYGGSNLWGTYLGPSWDGGGRLYCVLSAAVHELV
jgi:hypothetical protein